MGGCTGGGGGDCGICGGCEPGIRSAADASSFGRRSGLPKSVSLHSLHVQYCTRWSSVPFGHCSREHRRELCVCVFTRGDAHRQHVPSPALPPMRGGGMLPTYCSRGPDCVLIRTNCSF